MRHDRITSGCWLLLAGAWFATGCTSSKAPLPLAAERESIVISAAASTKEAIEELSLRFEQMANLDIKVNLGSSSSLATQIVEGAPADIFLSANEQWADELGKNNLVDERVSLLTNRLAIVTPSGNPAGIEKPEDLLKASVVKIALAGETVPAGQYADQALSKLKLLEPLTKAGKIARGQDVRSALAYIERGEAEAGIVYTTDAAAAKDVRIACEIDPALYDKIVYVLVLVRREERPAKAADYFAFLQSDESQAEFAKRGFIPLR